MLKILTFIAWLHLLMVLLFPIAWNISGGMQQEVNQYSIFLIELMGRLNLFSFLTFGWIRLGWFPYIIWTHSVILIGSVVFLRWLLIGTVEIIPIPLKLFFSRLKKAEDKGQKRFISPAERVKKQRDE